MGALPRVASNPPVEAQDHARAADVGELPRTVRQTVAKRTQEPADFEGVYRAAERAVASDQHQEAIRLLLRAVESNPESGQAQLLLAQCAARLGSWDVAIHAYRALHALHPDQPEILVNLGAVLEKNGDLGAAEHAYRKALELRPHFSGAHLNLGNVLRLRGMFDAARQTYECVLEHEPRSVKAWTNLANLYKLQGALDAAESHFRRALAMDPANNDLLLGLGAALHDQGRLDEAIAFYEQALKHDPTRPEVRLNLAHALLAKGDLKRGWPMLEVRFHLPQGGVKRRYAGLPSWRGEALDGKRLLVWGEQGIGDEILFASMYPELGELDAEITVACHSKLVALFRRSFPALRVVAYGDPETDDEHSRDYDVQVASGSVGALLRPDLGSFPPRRSYLLADAARCDHWRQELGRLGPELKIGFCWRSSNRAGERALSCTELEQWDRLFALKGVRWFSLQYDECARELEAAAARHRSRIVRFDLDYRDDLDEVSALMNGLDLVVSAPTAVSTHAAALGVETWQLSFGADWQVMGTGGNAWLPALRRYPRRWTETWDVVFERIAGDLTAVVE